MGEKHLPAAESLETDRGGGAQRGREPEGEGMKRVGGGVEVRGTDDLGKGLKTANTR